MKKFNAEINILREFTKKNNLKNSVQREKILEIFLSLEKHMSVEEFYKVSKKKIPSVGIATIYRSLKIFCSCGLAKEHRLYNGLTLYEHLYNHNHHDHFICIKCHKMIEFFDATIENTQKSLAKKYNFKILNHSLQLYGICKHCKNN